MIKGKKTESRIISDKEFSLQNEEKAQLALELLIANKALAFQIQQKEKRAAELVIANKELVFQNNEKEKRASELVIANKELAFQNDEKEKRASELITANKELAFQNDEKEKRASELSITNNELRKAEEKIKKVNRLYAFSSQVNQQIVRIKDGESFLENFFRIALELGKFKMAWIGMFNKEQKKITLTGQGGIAEEDVRLFTDIPFQANGPQDYVLRNNSYYVCNDMAHYFELENWKALAEKHGILSCIVLPIRQSGNLIGTLNLYAGELNFFDREEVSLLQEVANDISFAFDIMEKAKRQKDTEVLINKNENRFRALIEKSSEMKTLSTSEGKMIYCSPSVTKILGYSLEEFISTFAFHFIHPDDIPAYKEKRNGIIEVPGKSFTNQNRFLHKNGNWVWCEGTVTNMLDEPGINALVSNFVDITEKKLTEKQIEFDNNNLNALINNTNDLMWSVDREFKLITSNKGFDESVKLMSGSIIEKGGSVFTDGFPVEQLKKYKKIYEQVFAGQVFTEIEHSYIPDEIWYEISYNPIRKGNEIIGAACHSRDITNIKKGERQLNISEAGLKEAQAIAHVGSWQLGFATNVLVLSDEGCRIFGLPVTKNELSSETWIAMVHPEDREEILLRIEESRTTLKENSYDHRIVLKDGTMKHIHSESKFKLDSTGMVTGMDGTMQDVTEQRNADDKIKQSENRFREFFESAPETIVIFDVALNKFVRFNDNALKLLKYSAEELLKKGPGDISPQFQPDGSLSQEKAKEFTLNAIEGHKPVFEWMFIDANGKGVLCEVRLAQLSHIGSQQLLGTFIDITERKNSEKKLVQSEARLSEAQSIGRISNWEIDLINNNITWSDELFNIFGIKKEETEPSTELFFSFLHPDDAAMVRKTVQESFNTAKASSSVFRFIRNDGQTRFGYIERKFELNKTGKPIRLYGILQDITERMVGEMEREKLITDMIQRNRDLEQFSYIISHNLRAPTANIIGYSEILQDETTTPAEQQELLKGLTISVLNLDNVIKDINKILQVKRDLEEKKELISFTALVNDIFISIGNLVDKHRVRIKPDFSAVDEIYSLKGYIHSVFYNLISNSIKYRQPGVPPLIEITSHKSDGKIILIFKDNGLGIDMKTKGDKVFGLYNRFHSHVEGKGMGLFMVKTQVESLGGKITIESEPDKGTQFTIEFKTK